MSLANLQRTIEAKGIDPAAVTIGRGLPNADEQYCIERGEEGWEVYYAEKGQKGGLRVFSAESEACAYLLRLLKKDATIRKT